MMIKRMFVLFVLSLIVSSSLCQTFQYSRGWTNGKRSSEFSSLPEIFDSGDEHLNNNELKRLKMLLYGNVDEQPLLIRCDFVDKLKKFIHTDNYASQPLRREKGPNDNNY